MKVRLENVRGAFLFLNKTRKPMKSDDGEAKDPKHEGTWILSKDSKVIAFKADGTKVATTMESVLNAVATEKFGAGGPKLVAAMEDTRKCFRSGDKKVNKDGDVYEGFEGNTYVVAKCKEDEPPKFFTQNKEQITDPRDVGRLFQPGSFFDVIIDVYGLDVPGQSKGVFSTLKGVQIVKKGPFLGSGTTADADDFEERPAESVEADDLL